MNIHLLIKTSIFSAISTIFALAVGSFLGGIISRRIEMTPQASLKLLMVFDFINLVCLSSGFFLGCDQPVLAGDSGNRYAEVSNQPNVVLDVLKY